MPSLWRKHKGNRFSRLVSDFQTPPKRGGSLVVETGFPTSIVDLFVKNRDRLKKPLKKKRRSKQQISETSTSTTDQSLQVSDSSVSQPELDIPISSNDEKKVEKVAHHRNSDFSGEKTVAQQNPFVEICHGCCKKKYEEDDYDEEMGENGGDLSFKSWIWLWVLKGLLLLIIPLYTKRLVVGVTLGALLLLVLEYVGNWVFQFSMPCEDAKRKVQNRGLNRPTNIDFIDAKKGVNGVVLKRAIEEEIQNPMASKCGILNDATSRGVNGQEIESISAPKGAIERGNARTFPVGEIEVFEPNSDLMNPKGDNVGDAQEIEPSKMVVHNGKTKKGKKFWKKLGLKHRKKKHKKGMEQHEMVGYGCEMPTYSNDEIIEEEDDEPYSNEHEKISGSSSLSSLTSSFNEDESGATSNYGVASESSIEMLQCDNTTLKSCGSFKNRVANFTSLAIVGITLVGLIRSRIFALVLTIMCCVLFKIVKKLRSSSIAPNTN